jgi:uncharacterized membrane protein
MGQGLLGAGLATLYFSAYAAANFYHLIEQMPAFVLMSLVTLLAGGIAVRFNSMLVAVLGILGGYGTPIMLSTGVMNYPGLFGYVLVLGIGVLVICYWKNWPLVNYLSFFCTYGLVFASLVGYESSHFWEVMPFLIAFFVLFSTMTFLYKIVNRAKSNLLDVLALLINAGVFFGVGYWLIEGAYSREWASALSLGLAAFYTLHVYYFLMRRLVDRELLVSFIGLAAFLLAVTMPLLLSREWVTASWAIQALVLLWMAEKMGSEFLRHVCYVLFAIVILRFGFVDLQGQFLRTPPSADLTMQEYLWQLGQRALMFGIPIASLALGFRLLGRRPEAEAKVVADANDIPPLLRGTWAMRLVIGAAALMLFVYLHFEFDRTFGHFYSPMRLPMLTVLWLAICMLILYEFLQRESRWVLGAFVIVAAVVLVKMFAFDLPSWGLSDRLLYFGPYSFRDAAMRLVDFAAVVGFFAAAYAWLGGRSRAKSVRAVLGFTAIVMLFIYTTLEVNTFLFNYLEGMQAGGVSILWSLFALGLLLGGIKRNVATLRYLGLALFAVVAWKVFFNDLATLDQLYRIVAFILLGILILAGSFLYLKFRDKFTIGVPGQTKE